MPPRQPQPGRHVWTLPKDGARIDCELHSQAEFGWETQTLRCGEFSTGRMFGTLSPGATGADLEREGSSETVGRLSLTNTPFARSGRAIRRGPAGRRGLDPADMARC